MYDLSRRSLLTGLLGAGLMPWRTAGAAVLPEGPLLGVNLGNHGPAAIEAYEAWLGRKVDFVQVHTGRRGWDDYTGSVAYGGNLYKNSRDIHWSVPLFIEGGSLDDAAAGKYDKYWRQAIRSTRTFADPGDSAIFMRTGWEFNYKGQPWFSGGRERQFADSLRRFVDIMRTVSDRFKFVWCPNYDVKGQNTELSYPGDDYVDVISMDFYVYQGFRKPAKDAWDFYRYANGGYGLEWMVGFAKAHNKPLGVDEWGVMFDNYEEYITLAADFFRENNFLYTAYWEETAAYNAKLSDHHLPKTARRFIEEFGKK